MSRTRHGGGRTDRCRRLLLQGFAAACGLPLAGCAGVGSGPVDLPPRVSLADVSLAEFGLLEQRLDLVLSIQNLNAGAIEVRGLACTLAVNGAPFATGVSQGQLKIDPYATGRYHAEVRASAGSVFRQLQALLQGGRDRIDYRLDGHLDVTGLGRVPFEHTGDLPLPGLLGPLLDSPAPGRRSDRA